ncbi:polysaccharide deacetylase family protein [Draconibacterium sp. IB214405]|uniref:polysaccharide deacetylase family protein n=1 Tax=Draconibacterium sp. IB214405 TaxID=3097352 RepID=UPI002A10A757|nr:polysaccharide deacetylase family protein [Draconibacterium sp. IB214405]MDX8341550.1 polysaccharide deacetylase family protein [Draconibacterium sp. IB214405]
MRHFPRLVSKKLSPLFSTRKLLATKAPLFLPFYHVVSDDSLPHILNYPTINEKQFKQELDFYLKYFKPVSLEELIKSPQANSFHLSFDDGLKECAEVVAPILLQKGIPATFFVNSGFVDNKELFHRYKASLILNEINTHPDAEVENFLRENKLPIEQLLQTPFAQRTVLDQAAEMLDIDFKSFLEKHQPYMTTGQIKELHTKGFSIGGHSHKHPEFWKITEKKQLKHIKKSMDWVVENINPEIKAFAFPYTDDGVSCKLLNKIHDKGLCDVSFGTAGVKYDEIPKHLQRYPAEQKGDFEGNVKAEFIYFKLRKVIGKATVKH